MSVFPDISRELNILADKQQALILQRFFKTGKGQYGEGDIFLGIRVPVARQVALKYKIATMTDVSKLLKSKFHEYRLVGLFILIKKYEDSKNIIERKTIFNFYLKNTRYINNWDLVDLSAPKIVGNFLFNYINQKEIKNILGEMAHSNNLWEKRIAIVATFYFIRQGSTKEVFYISEILLSDKHDLIHKAVGWMLREAGKRIGTRELLDFLKKYGKVMPRTALRYSIERFPEKQRKSLLDCRF